MSIFGITLSFGRSSSLGFGLYLPLDASAMSPKASWVALRSSGLNRRTCASVGGRSCVVKGTRR
jgi:hypothetical protein